MSNLRDEMQTDLFTKTHVRDACEAAEQIAAMVETMAERKASTRQIAQAVRAVAARLALVEARPERAVDASVWIAGGSQEWNAWSAFWRATKGAEPAPFDKRGGWRFLTQFPPVLDAAE